MRSIHFLLDFLSFFVTLQRLLVPLTYGRFASDKCSGVKPALRCYNRGYRDPNDCSKCKCPEGFGRRQCRDPAPVNGGMLSR